MENKYLKNLELDKIINKAIEYAACPETKQMMLAETLCTNPEDVRFMLAQTNAVANRLLKNGSPRISACEGAVFAVERAEKQGILSFGELLNIAASLRNFDALASWYKDERDHAHTPCEVDDLFYSITAQPQLYKDITSAILSPEEIADNASGELYSLRRKIRAAEGSIREKLDGIIKNQNTSKYLQEALVSIRNGRFVVPVKSEHRGDVHGVIHDVSQSGGTLFVEPTAVVEANAKILQLKNQELAEIDRILQEFTLRVADIAPLYHPSWHAMLQLDRILAKSAYGLAIDGVCPAVNTQQHFNLVKVRHPLLDKSTAVPIDIELGKDYNTLVITGPNTGGKTVSLKTAGLCSAMVQMGYMLPAHDSSSVCVFKDILNDIGDEQSIEQSLSTFSGHMSNIIGILKQAGPRSLVLLDELGAGTDPAEGAALAIAIIENLRSAGARVMATTHYAELKMFALETQGVQNASSEFNIETLRPTYKLAVGIPGRSNAFLISEKLGLSAQIIDDAKRHMSTEQQRFETVLTQLEDAQKELKSQEQEIHRLQNAATMQLEAGKKKYDELVQQGEAELQHARSRAKQLTEEVQTSAFELMDELKKLEKENRNSAAQNARRARQIANADSVQLGRIAAEGEPQQYTNHTPLTSAAKGDEVWVPDMGKSAIVIAAADKAGQVELRIGAIKTKLPLESLAKMPPKGANKPPAKKGSSGRLNRATPLGERTTNTEINLLGKTVEEALLETDQFLDGAVMNGLSTVYIIHGRGTGALRTAISQHLKRHKHIKSYRLGVYGEGEDGVTVAELK